MPFMDGNRINRYWSRAVELPSFSFYQRFLPVRSSKFFYSWLDGFVKNGVCFYRDWVEMKPIYYMKLI